MQCYAHGMTYHLYCSYSSSRVITHYLIFSVLVRTSGHIRRLLVSAHDDQSSHAWRKEQLVIIYSMEISALYIKPLTCYGISILVAPFPGGAANKDISFS